jgi:hypothetical protein
VKAVHNGTLPSQEFARSFAVGFDVRFHGDGTAENALRRGFIDPGALRLSTTHGWHEYREPEEEHVRAAHLFQIVFLEALRFRGGLQSFRLENLAALLNDVEAVDVKIF